MSAGRKLEVQGFDNGGSRRCCRSPEGLHDVIFSAFGLQQIPRPIGVVESWVRHLKPGGTCTILYWPPSQPHNNQPPDCPFAVWGRLVRKRLGREDDEDFWDDTLIDAIESYADVLEDEHIQHEICWIVPQVHSTFGHLQETALIEYISCPGLCSCKFGAAS